MLVENFRAGVLARLGFGWDRLRELNPSLVYCAITGFGQTGPMSQAPAYDQIIQGLSGMMSITGTQETAPLRVGFPVCDTIGGLMAALAICAALAGRERTGEGCLVDVSMLEASMSAMGWAATHYLISGVAPAPMGRQNVTAAPSGTFDTADGRLNIAANRQSQFETLCRVIDRADLLSDPRFADSEARKRHREALDRGAERGVCARAPRPSGSRSCRRSACPRPGSCRSSRPWSHPSSSTAGSSPTSAFPGDPTRSCARDAATACCSTANPCGPAVRHLGSASTTPRSTR